MSEICFDLPRHGLGCRALRSGGLGFLYQRFSLPVRNEALQFGNQQAERWSDANHGSIGDSWPIAFSGCPRGPRVGCETACPRHVVPNFSAETRSRTRVSPEPDGHRWEKIQGWADSVRNTQAVCGFRCWASKHTPFFHTSNTIAAIFLAKVRRAISARIPLASRPV
jgi:hypothetical protein